MQNPFEVLEAKLNNLTVIAVGLQSTVDKLIEKKQLPDSNEFLSRQQVADLLHVSLPTIDGYIRSGILKAYRIGRRVKFKRDEVETALKQIKIQ